MFTIWATKYYAKCGPIKKQHAQKSILKGYSLSGKIKND